MIKDSKGITLIALVITIVILLILATITISALTGENGLITRTKEAREKVLYNTAYEELKLKILEVQSEKMGEITLADIVKKLEEDTENQYIVNTTSKFAKLSNQGNIITADIENGTLVDKLVGKTEIYVIYKGYEFSIKSDLTINFVNIVDGDKTIKSIVLSSTEETITAGNTLTLTAIVTPHNLEIEWSTDNDSIATVTNGIVTGVSQGEVNIKATIKDTNISATCKIVVTKSVAKIDDMYYNSLSDAINAVPTTEEEKTIILLDNTSENIEITSGKKIIYNGGSYTLTGAIINKGKLTINNGTITKSQYPITNYGSLNIRGGNIYTQSANTIVNEANLNIYGGYIYSSSGNDYILWNRGVRCI